MRWIGQVVAALVLWAAAMAVAPEARAYPHERTGFLIGFGLGGGSADVNYQGGGDTDRETGFGGNFLVGYAPRPDIAVHLETTGWYKEQDNASVTLRVAAAALTVYPGNVGFFVRGGVGFATSRLAAQVEELDGYTLSLDEYGFGLLGAVGYEVRLSRKFALGPQVDYAHLFLDGDAVNSANFINGSLQFTWYW